MTALLAAAALAVAFANGANANFKGVATLYGGGLTTLRAAALWGTAATLAGSLASLLLAGGLLAAFRGRGLVPDALAAAPEFACAVALGAALTGLLATRLGLPVSTTHALVGGLVGAGLASGEGVRLAALGANFVYPLLFSPAVAALAAALVYRLWRPGALPRLHVFAGGAASFARGLNDTPKMAALLIAVPALGANGSILAVSLAVAVGGLLAIDRVAETLGRRVTGMDAGQGLAAALVTAALVTTASLHGLPVSTTHVSVGALMGVGIVAGRANGRVAGGIVLAWVTTVPLAALLSAGAWLALVRVNVP